MSSNTLYKTEKLKVGLSTECSTHWKSDGDRIEIERRLEAVIQRFRQLAAAFRLFTCVMRVQHGYLLALSILLVSFVTSQESVLVTDDVYFSTGLGNAADLISTQDGVRTVVRKADSTARPGKVSHFLPEPLTPAAMRTLTRCICRRRNSRRIS